MMSNHKHHIVPIYKCIELGLTTSYKVDGIEFYFKENVLPDTARLVHADIHWGYYCKDLSTLLEHCNPPQWVIDMIPLGDNRDMWAAKLLAEGEIDGIDCSTQMIQCHIRRNIMQDQSIRHMIRNVMQHQNVRHIRRNI